MIVSREPNPPMEVEYIQVTDPVERAKNRARLEHVKRNHACWNAHAAEFYSRYRGKCICIAGEEYFVADTALEARELGKAAHPEDDASFVLRIPKEKMVRI